jgi:hypothetical protein
LLNGTASRACEALYSPECVEKDDPQKYARSRSNIYGRPRLKSAAFGFYLTPGLLLIPIGRATLYGGS